MDDAPPRVRLHALVPRSRANGPGLRTVLWFQGCSLGCPGCFNPDTHRDGGGRSVTVAALIDRFLAEGPAIEGITLTGGEPLEQPESLLALLAAVRDRTTLSVILFSGFTRREVLRRPAGREILAKVDVLIDGRYVAPRRSAGELRGSTNQRVHLLSARYSATQIADTPPAEVLIGPDGQVVITGVSPPLPG